jgi:hypothetical protein
MTGFEFLIDPAAKGLEAFITDTVKVGSGSAIANTFKDLKAKGSQAIFNASRKYIETYQKRHCQLRVLGMREPVDLSAVYTGVQLLDARSLLQFDPTALEESFRKTRFQGYAASHHEGKKQPGVGIANQKQYLMVLGGPGAGKSTFLRKVGLEALRTFYYEKAEYKHRLIPVLLELKRFEASNIDIAKFISDEFETCGFPEAQAFTQNALTQGNLVILLDGLDEVPSANLDYVLKTIRDFVDRYDKNRFIASCRVAASGYRSDAFKRFSNVTMADFDDEQIRQFIGNWFGSEQDVERKTAEKCWEVLQKSENKASKELAHTPLLLTYLCLVYDQSQRFPDNRSSLYKKALRILLEEWAAEKRILRDDIYEGLSIEQEEILLAEIAYEGMVADQLFFDKRELSNQIKTFLSSNLNAPKHLDSEAVLNAIEVQQGVLVQRAEGTYSFSHLTLQEYLTAQYLIDNHEWEALIKKHLTDTRWREIFLLMPGLMTGKIGADRFLLAIEQHAAHYISSHNLKQLIQWSQISTQGSAGKTTPAAKRIAAIFIALARALDHDLDLDLALARARALEQDLDLDLDLDLTLARALDRDFDLALAHDLYLARIFGSVNFGEFMQALKALHNQLPTNLEYKERLHFFEKIDNLWFSALGIEAETVRLSQEDSKSLADYFYACKLMIRCKENAVRVSPEVWAGIESRILTVMD